MVTQEGFEGRFLVMVNEQEQNNLEEKRRGGPEKRAFPRIKKEITVQYRIKELPQVKAVQITRQPTVDISRTKDLSEAGIFFTASQDIPAQSILELKLQLPSQETFVELEGRVVDCEEIKQGIIYGIRIEFVNLKDEQKEVLREFVQLFKK